MATCHSLLLLDGKIQGDPLDLKMFEGTNWVSLIPLWLLLTPDVLPPLVGEFWGGEEAAPLLQLSPFCPTLLR